MNSAPVDYTATWKQPSLEIRYNQPMPVAFKGVFSAAVTPLKPDFSIDLNGINSLLDFLAERGCHGALLFGTTGEGPSFSPGERLEALRVARDWRRSHPDFRLLAGTGTPSLQETIELTRAAFEIGIDGVVTLPPYYFRTVSDDGLFAWFKLTIQNAVPPDGAFFGYHFPGVSGVALSIDLIARLKDAFPDQFVGIKDSSGEPTLAIRLGERFGDSLAVFTGNDRLFSTALANHAAGCITAMANIASPDLRSLWQARQSGDLDAQNTAQSRLDNLRQIFERYPPWPPLLKALLASNYYFPRWPARPPLLDLPTDQEEKIIAALKLLV